VALAGKLLCSAKRRIWTSYRCRWLVLFRKLGKHLPWLCSHCGRTVHLPNRR
jgi:hypothetical protein